MAARHKMTTASSRRMKSRYFRLARRGLGVFFGFWLVLSSPAPCGSTSAAESEAGQGQGLKPILEYISSAWDTLTRSMSECESVADPKIKALPTIYLPAGFAEPDALKKLTMNCDVRVEYLPVVIHHLGEIDTAKLQPPGLLYLENKYVVPGGRFNEMYGWDSYFIIRGLLRAGKVELARGMVENFFFEIEHYGAVLNANRTYYLSRSQPPFLTSMILGVYEAQKAQNQEDRAWLERAYSYAVRDHALWINDPHLAGDPNLSRYFDFGEGPAPESLKDETDHYQKVAEYFLEHPELGNRLLLDDHNGQLNKDAAGSRYSLELCDIPRTMQGTHCEPVKELSLSREYFKGDRSMRESGFDISFRFSAFGADTQQFAPVCLNSLLYKSEKDLESIATMLGHGQEAQQWKMQAAARQKEVTQKMWDAQMGEFLDFNFMDKT